jgi:hypothetical protein
VVDRLRRDLTALALACVAAVALSAVFSGPAGAATRVSYRAFDDQAERVFFDKGGLQLVGDCDFDDTMTVYARSTVNGATLHANSQGGNSGVAYRDVDVFNAGAGNQVNLLGSSPGLDAADSSSGQLVYGRPGGANVSVDWLAEEGDGYAMSRDCVFSGTARFVDGSSSSRANYRVNGPNSDTTFFNQGGLKLSGSCTMTGVQSITARTTTDNSMIHANSQYTGPGVDYEENDDFDDEDSFDLATAADGAMDNAIGQIIYAKPGGTNVTVDWAAEDDGDALGRDCVFNGTARVRSSGDPLRVNFRVPSGTAGPTTFFNQGGLKLSGTCSTGPDLDVNVSTTSDFASIHFNGHDPVSSYTFDNDFFNSDTDSPFELFTQLGTVNGADDTAGQIIYSSYGGTNVTIRFAGEEGDGFSNYPCVFVGAAEIGTP